MNIALMAVVGVVAFAVGFIIKGSSSQSPEALKDLTNNKFTFKGHLAVYYKRTPSEPRVKGDYRKRPKHSVKVLYKMVGGTQRGSVTFDNWTEEQIEITFPNGSPFADTVFIVGPNQSSGAQLLTVDPDAGKEKKYDFNVRIKTGSGDDDWLDFDPGVQVRRG